VACLNTTPSKCYRCLEPACGRPITYHLSPFTPSLFPWTLTAISNKLIWPKFDFELAWQIGARLRELGIARRCPIVVDVRYFGQPLFYSALPGSVPDNADWIRRKSNTVARFHRSSYRVGLTLKQAETTLLDRYALASADFSSHGGAFPVNVKDIGVIGSVAVSGLPQRDDHELVVEAICLALNRDYASLALAKE
jgi:uncharacterized protein (UPF0303 family)